MPINLGHIYATLGLDTAQLSAGATQAQGTLNRLGATMGGITKRLAQLGVAAGIAGVAMVSALVKTGADAIDAQNDLARSLGTNVNALRALQLAAGEAGVDAEVLNKALMMMNARLGEAVTGTGETYKALQKLGLSARDLAAMDADERMATLADRVRELGLSSAETANLLRDFGIRGGAMVDMMRQGGDAIRDASQTLKDFGLELSDIDVAMIDQAKESIARMGLVLEGVRNAVTVFLMPVLGELADRFNNAAKQSGGFGAMAVDALRSVAHGVAYVGNVIHGLNIAWGGMKVSFTGAAAAVATGVEFIAKQFTNMADVAVDALNAIIRGLQMIGRDVHEIPSFAESEFMQSLHANAQQMRDVAAGAVDELRVLMSERWPTEMVDEFFDAVDARRKKAEAELAGRAPEGGDTAGGDVADPETEKKKAALAEQLEAVREYGMDEYELLNKQLQDRMNLIREGVALGVKTEIEGREMVADVAARFVKEEQAIEAERAGRAEEVRLAKYDAAVAAFEQERLFAASEAEAEQIEHDARMQRVVDFYGGLEQVTADGHARLEELEGQHQERLRQIQEVPIKDAETFRKASLDKQLGFMSKFFADVSAGSAQHSKSMFELNKAAGIANAIVSTGQAIMKTWEAFGYPMGIPMVAAMAAAGVAQVQAIASAKFGGKGGTAPSLAGGTPATPVTPVTGGTPASAGTGRLMVEGIDAGSLFSGRQMRELAERLLEHQRDGGTVVFST